MADLIETQDEAIASYPFGDIEEGLGYVTYNGFADTDENGTNYNLGSSTVYSDPIYEGSAGAGGAMTIKFETSTFNLPRILLGTAIFNFGMSLRGSSGTYTCTPQIKLYHYDGSTETQLGSTWTGAAKTSTSVGNTANFYAQLAKVAVTTPKKFRKGDSLRVEAIFTNSSGGDTDVGHDPQNRDTAYINPSTDAEEYSTFTCFIPFKTRI